jgi:succinate dehydrogenase/fumarate reductase-like Fe-S protein
MYYWRNKMSKKYDFKNYTVLDRRQLDLLMLNMMKSLSNNSEKPFSSSHSCRNDAE